MYRTMLMKLELFKTEFKDGKMSFVSSNQSIIVNLAHIVKIVPVDGVHGNIYMLGDNDQYNTGYVSMEEFENKMRHG